MPKFEYAQMEPLLLTTVSTPLTHLRGDLRRMLRRASSADPGAYGYNNVYALVYALFGDVIGSPAAGFTQPDFLRGCTPDDVFVGIIQESQHRSKLITLRSITYKGRRQTPSLEEHSDAQFVKLFRTHPSPQVPAPPFSVPQPPAAQPPKGPIMTKRNLLQSQKFRDAIGAQYQDESRCSGRSTALALQLISKAIQHPNVPHSVNDHHGTYEADVDLLHLCEALVKTLGLKFFEFSEANRLVGGAPSIICNRLGN